MSEGKELTVHPEAEGFVDKITPKRPDGKLFMFECKRELPKPAGAPPPQPVDPEFPLNIELEGDGPYRTPPEPKNFCGSIHYRHAGYVKVMLPYLKPGDIKEVLMDNHQVMVCVKCKSSYVWAGGQMYDVTDKIDLKAWMATEKEAHEATGPGGQC